VDRRPNPLVVRVAQRVVKRKFDASDAAGKARLAGILAPQDQAVRTFQGLPADATPEQHADAFSAVVTSIENVLDKLPRALSAAMAGRILKTAVDEAQIPPLVLVAGYLGEKVTVLGDDWRVLYVDAPLQNWTLIPEKDILLHRAAQDRTAAFGKRDLLWLMGDALTADGEAPPRPKAQADFLKGPFTRAAELTEPIIGGDPRPDSGVFCQAITPRCCTRGVRPR
jgi:hypothetical protein